MEVSMEKEDYKSTCEWCAYSDICMILNCYSCKSFVQSIDSNYKYVINPDLFKIEKDILCKC